MHDQDDSTANTILPSPDKLSDLPEESDPDISDIADFEFRLEEPVNMLPADQLFSDGKLFPLSSFSSGHDPDDLPRLSLDSEKPLKNSNPNPNPSNPPRMKLVKTRTLSTDGSTRGVSADSPRMNSSGKIVFHSLERSSSSPSSFNGGPRLKHRGMERSYSSNVRITPILNVPVCSLRGFPLFSSSQKHEGSATRNQQMNNNNNNKSKTDRS